MMNSPNDLLEHYQSKATMFLTTPRHTLLASGVRAQVQARAGPGQRQYLCGQLNELFEFSDSNEGERAFVVGALPFDECVPAHLVLPEKICWGNAIKRTGRGMKETKIDINKFSSIPSARDYVLAVQHATRKICSGHLQKVVLARSLEIAMDADIDVHELLRSLVQSNPDAYVFALDVAEEGIPYILVGASPELLVSRQGYDVTANPLAGSARRSLDTQEDLRIGEALFKSAKDQREHAFVIQAVAESLRPFCSELRIPAKPMLMKTATMWHLSTQIQGRLHDLSISSLCLALALHPTPAICGTPTTVAQETIFSLEGFERGFYAGLVGWVDDSGDGEWAVTIRCATVQQRNIRLFAGAGIVEGSDAEAELNETSDKFSTILTALGISHYEK